MPRVCIVRHDYYPQSPHVRRDAHALMRRGFEVDVLCLRGPEQASRERVDGVNVYRLPLAKRRGGVSAYIIEYSIFFLLTFVALTFLSIRRRYHGVEVDTMPDILVFTAIVPKLLGANIVLFLFECMPEIFQHNYGMSSRHPVVRLLRFIEGRACRFADHVIYCGPGYRDIQEPRAPGPVKGSVVLNVPDESIFSPAKVTSPRESLNGAPFRVMTHGSILERYGLSTLIKSIPLLVNRIPDLEVLIVGDGQYRGVLEQLTKELGVDAYVTFMGHVPLDEVPEIISNADVGVVAFTHDCALAWKLFEYMAMQRPIVHSATKFTMEFCRNDEVLFFTPEDERDLADRLLLLYHRPDMRRGMVERASQLYDGCRWSRTQTDYLAAHPLMEPARQSGPPAASGERVHPDLETGRREGDTG